MKTIQERAQVALSPTNTFGFSAEKIATITPNLPREEQYVLRMMIKAPWVDGYKIPKELEWLRSTIELCEKNQKQMGLNQPFVYITVRHGIVKSVNDDVWHVDGFSMKGAPHIPEQNYIFCSNTGTEVLNQKVTLPEDFDPFKHNIHLYFQDVAREDSPIETLESNVLYAIDPYVIHRRPQTTFGTERTFFRISFIPLEIESDTCMVNPLILRDKPYNRKDIRDFLLERYK